jgi:hypothetical protein
MTEEQKNSFIAKRADKVSVDSHCPIGCDRKDRPLATLGGNLH